MEKDALYNIHSNPPNLYVHVLVYRLFGGILEAETYCNNNLKHVRTKHNKTKMCAAEAIGTN